VGKGRRKKGRAFDADPVRRENVCSYLERGPGGGRLLGQRSQYRVKRGGKLLSQTMYTIGKERAISTGGSDKSGDRTKKYFGGPGN